jgi:nucleoside-diphosphate-sugar epimerase
MPRLLIAGCGYLGQAVADLLLANGWDLEGWTMSLESAKRISAKPYSLRAVDISDARHVFDQKKNFDLVIHCASTRGGDVDSYRRLYLIGARNLLKQFGNAQLLFTSSTSVYAQNSGEVVNEESLAEPKHETGKILRETEDLVLGHHGIVVRLAGIYGPGRSALLRKFLSGEATVDLEADHFVNQIHRDDAASAIQFLLRRSESAGQVYNIVDSEPTLLSECYRWLASQLNRPLPAVAKSTSNRKRGESNKRVSNAKLRALGWNPRYPNFAEGMGKSVLPAAATP